jgi:fructose-specific component phosphotransferase system IIB-like protein
MVQTIIQAGVSPAKIHLIGFNLGAHIAAYVAKAIPGISRLTGKNVIVTSSFSNNLNKTKRCDFESKYSAL